jgi:hypothetical protein
MQQFLVYSSLLLNPPHTFDLQPVVKPPRGAAPRTLLGIKAEKRRVLNEIRGVSTTKSPSKSRDSTELAEVKRRPRGFHHGLPEHLLNIKPK